ncbi:hypothetical protein P7L74_05055 (plasmid) [Tistrella mobilis]|jgi:hypothetical protein|uniref:hypothetical protein n=1 Tax=Tistrella mobilis TaxID=171437 RepID=UPI003557875A
MPSITRSAPLPGAIALLLAGLAAMPAQAQDGAARYHSIFTINDRPQAVLLTLGQTPAAENRLRLAFGAPRNCIIDFEHTDARDGGRNFTARQASPGSWCERQLGEMAEIRILAIDDSEITYEFKTARSRAERHVGMK